MDIENMGAEELRALLEKTREENEKLKARQIHKPTLKVSEKKAVSVYGLGRFPVTLYKEQMLRFLDMADEIRSFIAENEAVLAVKAPKEG